MPIEELNKVDVETSVGAGTTDIADESFNLETGDTSNNDFWEPSSNTAGWENPERTGSSSADPSNVISTQNNANEYWYTTSQTDAPGIPANVEVNGWHCDALGTPSNSTGPNGGHAGSGNHDNVGGNEYLYAEMSNSSSRGKVLVMRTAGYSLGDASATDLELSFYVHAHGTAIGNFAVYEATSSTTYGNKSGTNLLAYFQAYSHYKNGGTSWQTNDGFTRLKGILKLSSGMQSWSTPFFNEEFGRGGVSDWKKVTIPLDGFYGDNATDYPDYRDDTTQSRYFYFVYHSFSSVSELTASASTIGSGSDTLVSASNITNFQVWRGDLAIDDFKITKTTGSASNTVHIESVNGVDADGTPAVSFNGVTLLSP